MTKKSPHLLHFGRPPNTALSNLHAKISDRKHLKRSMLTAEQRKQDFYSKDRLKVIRPDQDSADGRLKYAPTVPDKFNVEAQDAIVDLVNASEHWKELTKNLGTRQRCKLGRDILRQKPAEAALIREIDLHGLGFHFKEFPCRIKSSEDEEEEDDVGLSSTSDDLPLKTKGQGSSSSKLINFAIKNPSLVSIHRRVYNRASGTALFKKYNGTIVSCSNNTVKFKDGTILKQSDIEIKIECNTNPVVAKTPSQPSSSKPSSSSKPTSSKDAPTASEHASGKSAKKKQPTTQLHIGVKPKPSKENEFNLLDTLSSMGGPKTVQPNRSQSDLLFYNQNSTPGEPYLPFNFHNARGNTNVFTEYTRSADQPVADPNTITIQPANPLAQENPETSDASEIRTARDLAREMEANQNPDLRANTQPLSRSVLTEVSNQNSNDSPDITSDNSPNNVASEPKTVHSKVGRPKGTTNFQPDQSLILQGKRQRTPPERFEAKSIEAAEDSQPSDNTPRQTVIEPADSFSKFLLKEGKKKRNPAENRRRKSQNKPKKRNPISSSSE